ncbi:hypothetical protein A9Q99_26295 [Gammaproteobacteria bacterium 45_16_T64]|nr:hypothetical protein A9Q99_26295 [Gammaproteobacteria bacterium 45_16_T64]
MTLRRQLLFVSLCLLALPWAGCQYVKEMETVLRQNQQQLLRSAAPPIAQLITPTIQSSPSATAVDNNILYASFRDNPIALDGYEDEWSRFPAIDMLSDNSSKGYFKLAVNQHNLLLIIHIDDNDIRYHHPNSPSPIYNDHLRIVTGTGSDQRTIALYTSGQGAVQAAQLDKQKTRQYWSQLPSSQRIHGYWLEVENGYNVELSIPLSLIQNNVEISSFNTTPSSTKQRANQALTSSHKSLLYPIKELTQQLQPFRQSPWDIAIINSQGWVISPQNPQSSTSPAGSSEGKYETNNSLWKNALSHIYRYILEDVISSDSVTYWPLQQSNPSLAKQHININALTINQGQWYQIDRSQRSILSVNQPIYDRDNQKILAYVVLTQSNEALLTSTNNALLRVVNLSIGTAAFSAFILLGFASILSFRIRALRNKTEQAVSQDGKISTYTPSQTKDEIGDLSRSYGALLNRVNDYNQYLETLSGKLAHELRTPLTISKSSLEMLKMVDPQDTEKQQRYFARAEMGLERLRHLLNAMSEASRVEQSIQHSELHEVDLRELLDHMCQAYQDTYPNHQFEFQHDEGVTPKHTTLNANPELLAQMLDKLVDNATGFAPRQSTITFVLTHSPQVLHLRVKNKGPLLPESMQQQLFDSMVSIRQEKSDTPHLGLGLYIVKLIVQHHRGTLYAHNTTDNEGVEFCIELQTD